MSLETRIPLLDHRVVEFAWQVPTTLKFRAGVGKWMLRQVLYQYVPRELIERPKMSFGVPIGEWLRSPLHEWTEDLLNAGRLREEGYFDPLAARQKWEAHCRGHQNWQYPLWNVLMFQAWLAKGATGGSRETPQVGPVSYRAATQVRSLGLGPASSESK